MKLFSGPLTMFGAKAEIALLEKNISCEIERVQFGMRKRYDPKHPEIIRINPKQQIPVLVNGDVEIYDSTLIFEYLEDIHPNPALWPASPNERAKARLMELEADEIFFPFVQTIYRNFITPDADAVAKAKADAQTYFDKIEQHLTNRDYLCNTFTYADIALVCAHYFGDFVGVNLAPHHEKLNQWRQRVAQRPSVQSVLSATSTYLTSKGMTPPAFLNQIR